MIRTLLLRVALCSTTLVVLTFSIEGRAQAPAPATASVSALRFHWGYALYDFAWEYGESLTTRPPRGSDTGGRGWLDTSDGTGRANTWQGALVLDSQRGRSGPGDWGTTAVTLQGQPARYGRWELKEKAWTREGGPGDDFQILLELIPAHPADYHCGGQNVLIASHTARSGRVQLGINGLLGHRAWRFTQQGVPQGIDAPHTYAVEIAPDHITWFIDAKVIATIRDPDAIPRVAMTPRLSLVGAGTREMNRSRVIVDWVRGFDLSHGEHPANGAELREGSNPDAC